MSANGEVLATVHLRYALKIQLFPIVLKTGAIKQLIMGSLDVLQQLKNRNAPGMINSVILSTAYQWMEKRIFIAKPHGVLQIHLHQDAGTKQ